MSRRLFAVVTGGGTGGHVTPALAVAEALVDKGHAQGEIELVGGRRGIESRLVPEAGFVLHTLPGRGIRRSLTLENLSSACGLLAAVFMALRLAMRERPRVVVTVGGYAGFPYAMAAVLLRIPLVVVSVDAMPGAVNRLVGRFAAANAVAYEGTVLPRATVTGPPVRRVVLQVSRDEATRAKVCDRLGLEAGRHLVLVTGGSLGAGSINAATIQLASMWAERGDVAIYHVAGERNLEAVRAEAEKAGLFSRGGARLQYRLAGFDSDLVSGLAACDLAVCRAGGLTVAELTAIGVPSVLVPLPGAPADHQTHNASVLADAGASVMIADGECNGESLASAITGCFAEDGRIEAMSAAACSLGHGDAAEKVAELVEQFAAPDRTGSQSD